MCGLDKLLRGMDKIERLLVVFEAVKPPLVAKMFTVETPSLTD